MAEGGADEKVTGRIFAHYTKMETMEVGDVPGHFLGVAKQTGLMFRSTGEIVKKAATFHFDLLKGKGMFVDYSLYTDQDGSTLVTKAVGTAGPVDDGKKFIIEGTFECIGGTGKYDGYIRKRHLQGGTRRRAEDGRRCVLRFHHELPEAVSLSEGGRSSTNRVLRTTGVLPGCEWVELVDGDIFPQVRFDRWPGGETSKYRN